MANEMTNVVRHMLWRLRHLATMLILRLESAARLRTIYRSGFSRSILQKILLANKPDVPSLWLAARRLLAHQFEDLVNKTGLGLDQVEVLPVDQWIHAMGCCNDLHVLTVCFGDARPKLRFGFDIERLLWLVH